MSEIRFYNTWRTKTPADRAHLIATMEEKAGMFASKPGFVSLIVSECAADGRVMAEGIWQSREAFDKAVASNPEAHSGREQMEALGVPEPGVFAEMFRIEPDKALWTHFDPNLPSAGRPADLTRRLRPSMALIFSLRKQARGILYSSCTDTRSLGRFGGRSAPPSQQTIQS